MEQNTKWNKCSWNGKIIGKDERTQRNSWFGEECQIVLENKKRASSSSSVGPVSLCPGCTSAVGLLCLP
jgi:hypothetical protein